MTKMLFQMQSEFSVARYFISGQGTGNKDHILYKFNLRGSYRSIDFNPDLVKMLFPITNNCSKHISNSFRYVRLLLLMLLLTHMHMQDSYTVYPGN